MECFNRANSAMINEDFEQAVLDFSDSIAQNPEHAASYCNRAAAYIQLKEYEKAIEVFIASSSFHYHFSYFLVKGL